MQARDYQRDLEMRIHNAWFFNKNVMATLPTGAGKTFVFAKIMAEHEGVSCAIAHRKELVGQMSLALAYNNVRHRVIGPKILVEFINYVHMSIFGKSFYDPNANCAVASVNTIISRKDTLGWWLKSVTLWVQDEGHHILKDNMWGEAAALMPNAKGLAVTATAGRADGKGLGRHADGIIDVLIEGPEMRYLIKEGYLTDYRVICPSSDLDLTNVKVSAKTGDYTRPGVVRAVRQSSIVGDVVTEYIKVANGKLGVTFVTDITTAGDVAADFNARGVPAEVISHKTPDRERAEILRRFKSRDVLQLVNVDLFGEGFDLPAIQVVSFARPTQSLNLYIQQFGRGLRVMLDDAIKPITRDERLAAIAASIKPRAIIIDHVKAVLTHYPPDRPRKWTLDRRPGVGRTNVIDEIPQRICVACTSPFERFYKACSHCGHVVEIEDRSQPEFVDGDLQELDDATLARLRGEVAEIDMDKEDYRTWLQGQRAPLISQLTNVKRHVEKQETQKALRDCMSWWAGVQKRLGRDDSESQRRFFYEFGIDVLSAQALKRKDADALATRVCLHMGRVA